MPVIRERSNQWYGFRRDMRDARDRHFNSTGIDLPRAVDLRQWCPPVMNQGNLGSCTAHGITGALRYLIIKTGKADYPLSRLQLYYDERAVEGSIGQDSGAEIRDGIKCAAKIGVAHEKLWTYKVGSFTRKPAASVYRDAHKFEALAYERVAVDTPSLKAALALGFPVVIGITVYDSFESDDASKTGMIPMPDLSTEQPVGGHCLYAVGYGQKRNCFTVRNSWDTDWGDAGDCYIPFDYLGSANYGSDYWVIKGDTLV